MSAISPVSTPSYQPSPSTTTGGAPRVADKPKDGDAKPKADSTAASKGKLNVLA